MNADRARARAAAAVRRRERLVQVELHDVDARVAGARLAEHRVHVRAVAVHEAALFVHDVGDLAELLSNRPSVFGFVIMMAATSSAVRSARPA